MRHTANSSLAGLRPAQFKILATRWSASVFVLEVWTPNEWIGVAVVGGGPRFFLKIPERFDRFLSLRSDLPFLGNPCNLFAYGYLCQPFGRLADRSLWVRFPSPAPLIIKDLRRSASKVQVETPLFRNQDFSQSPCRRIPNAQLEVSKDENASIR